MWRSRAARDTSSERSAQSRARALSASPVHCAVSVGAGPNGLRGFEVYSVAPEFPHGSLLVRVRQYQDDSWTYCGSGCTFTAERDGYLDFVVNDKDFANNSGSYEIEVRVLKD